jgi:hypothetical protein
VLVPENELHSRARPPARAPIWAVGLSGYRHARSRETYLFHVDRYRAFYTQCRTMRASPSQALRLPIGTHRLTHVCDSTPLGRGTNEYLNILTETTT